MSQLFSNNGIVICDFNKEGSLVVVLAGNFYSSEVETLRSDAVNSLLLKGDKKGIFNSEPFFNLFFLHLKVLKT